MNLVLIGFMATGKSAVGRLIAKRLGWQFFDTDEMIEKETGLSVAEIFTRKGEPEFRALEARAVGLVALLDKCVIATGGGAPLSGDNMRELERNSAVVCLTARPETILARLKDGGASRPLLKGRDPLLAVEELLAARKKAYARAKFAVPTDDLNEEQVAEKVLQAVKL